MIDIPKNEKDHIRAYAEALLRPSTAELPPREFLIRAYQELLETSSSFEGEVMVETLLSQMEEFQAYYLLCQREPVHGDRIYLHHLLEGRSLEEQCHALHDLSEGLRLMTEGGEPRPYEGTPSPEARDRLLEQTLFRLERQATAPLPEKPEGDAPLTGWGPLFPALAALTFYAMAKNGQLKDCPREVTLQQAAACICQEMAAQETALALEEEAIIPEEAEFRRKTAKKASILLMLAAGVLGGIFTSLFQRKLPLVIAALQGILQAGKRLLPQTEEIFAATAKRKGLAFSGRKLLQNREIPVPETLSLPKESRAAQKAPAPRQKATQQIETELEQ